MTTISWDTGSLGWSCHGKDVPLSELGSKRRKRRAQSGRRAGQLRVEAPCPKCSEHWVTVGWEDDSKARRDPK